MKIKIIYDNFGNNQRASTWLFGKCYVGLGESDIEARNQLLDKIKSYMTPKGLAGEEKTEMIEI